MSVARLVTVECDAPRCPAVFTPATDNFDHAVDLAAEAGWSRNDDTDEDFCPEHTEA